MNIRPASRADLPSVLEIYNEAVLNTTATYDDEPRTLEHRIAWFEDHEKHDYPCSSRWRKRDASRAGVR